MIEKIELKQVATFDEVGTVIKDLQKINFIYGANGSGKTTVSNFIYNSSDDKYTNCNIKWKNDQRIDTVVYNKIFKENNFNSTNTIKGVFTLGQATENDIKIINEKKEQLKTIKEQSIKVKTSLDKLQGNDESLGDITVLRNNFKEYCWKKIYKEYENNFKEAFKGSMQKQLFNDKLLNEHNNNTSSLVDIKELNEKAKTIFGDTPLNIDSISIIEFFDLNTIEKNDIWGKKIIGKSDVNIAKLIKNLNINDWVNQGKEYLQDNNICPFCQQETISDNFRMQLENYFNTTFMESVESIKLFQQNYNLLSKDLINQLNQIEFENKNNPNTKLDIDMFSIYLKTLFGQINSNKEILNNKIKEPSRSLKLISTQKQFNNIKSLIDKANEEIKKHNDIVLNYKTEKDQLISSIWKFIVHSSTDEIKNYITKDNGLLKGKENLLKSYEDKKQELQSLNKEIKELDKNVTSVQPTIDKINNTLKCYEFLNFEIVPSEIDINQYQIKREDGSLAQETLSEGEITFITFLYYYHLTKGGITQDEVSNDRILIIDDPISSLDSNVLFIVSTLIKEIIEDIKTDKGDIKQLIILTHNVYFHKEVSFINSRDNSGRRDTFFWILRKINKVSSFTEYNTQNPIQTSYQLLWQEIKDKDNNSIVTIQNTMRRIIENYFKILGNYKDSELIKRFDTYEKQIICKSLISWINDGSHSIADDLYIEIQNDSVDKYLELFKNIYINKYHEGHYNMMINI
jgi:wobble nucleotide-excising tRNase